MDFFKTISGLSEGYITEQRSKFLSFAVPVQTPEEAKDVVDTYRKKYYDARHVCWAYLLGAERNQFRVNDDGEPSSTAGKPILGVINSHELTNILMIVVRYFGGVKLGTSGLIAAYRAAAQAAVQNAQIIEKTVDEAIAITFAYPFLNGVMKIVKDMQPQIISQAFDNDCRMVLRIRKSDAERLKTELKKIASVSFQ
ncbi:MAG: YigZ family protein [Dysgonamonadaceae bacterium]|nr:YigZ family protein [Dysgonamonadaceae bacterium]